MDALLIATKPLELDRIQYRKGEIIQTDRRRARSLKTSGLAREVTPDQLRLKTSRAQSTLRDS